MLQKRALNIRLITANARAGILASWMIPLFAVSPPVYGQSKATANIVRVTITTRGLYLSHSAIKPGAVQLLIENRTLIKHPQLQVTDARLGLGPNARAGIATGAAAARKNFQGLTLPPGSYILSLTADPAAKASLEVRP